MKIIRVFPRRTKATPDDELAFVGHPPFWHPPADEVHISCTFTWDRALCENLAIAWGAYYPVVMFGGPAYDHPGGEFVPGMYLKPGYTITSRGCPGRCAFCFVPKREGELRTLPIRPGWDVLDNNLLACPESHLEAVFSMLRWQPFPARFTGGLEASRVTPHIARELVDLKFDIAYTAYDRPGEKPWVERAIGCLREAGGWSLRTAQRKLGCYVLCAYEGDTAQAIETRLRWVTDLGATPFPMFFRRASGHKDPRTEELKRSLRRWMRPANIYHKATESQMAIPALFDEGAQNAKGEEAREGNTG